MPLGILFWVLWVVALVFGFALHGGYVGGAYGGYAGSLLVMILFGIIGWKLFGPVVQ
jgi:hypothetical protein